MVATIVMFLLTAMMIVIVVLSASYYYGCYRSHMINVDLVFRGMVCLCLLLLPVIVHIVALFIVIVFRVRPLVSRFNLMAMSSSSLSHSQ